MSPLADSSINAVGLGRATSPQQQTAAAAEAAHQRHGIVTAVRMLPRGPCARASLARLIIGCDMLRSFAQRLFSAATIYRVAGPHRHYHHWTQP